MCFAGRVCGAAAVAVRNVRMRLLFCCPLESVQCVTRCGANCAACRFAGTTRFFRAVRAGRPCRRAFRPFQGQKAQACRQPHRHASARSALQRRRQLRACLFSRSSVAVPGVLPARAGLPCRLFLLFHSSMNRVPRAHRVKGVSTQPSAPARIFYVFVLSQYDRKKTVHGPC